ncbi:protein phosphatase 2C 6 [Hirschfeldia incana]|nr:protein phosphatase 2C 6 [Hirschfeldia incana]
MGLCSSRINKTTGNETKTTSTPTTTVERQGSGGLRREKDLVSGGVINEAEQLVGRLVGNGSSESACLYTQQGSKGTNQDAMLVWENFCSRSDTVLCGVFDGHGPFGHMVAKRVRDMLPFTLSTQLKKASAMVSTRVLEPTTCKEDEEECCELQPSEKDDRLPLPEMYLPLKRALLKTCKQMDKELKMHPTINCFCSGTTSVTVIKQGKDLVVGNIGDSRAVLATRDEDNALIAVQLTIDLKPDLPSESARIQKCKGRVFALQDEPEVARVWLPNSDSPGLAMARAFGDFCLKDYGLISVPDINYHRLTERDQFIILATDGVWDVLSNKEAVDIVASAPSRNTAARALVCTAVRAWRLKYPTSKNDDCAVVCLFLEDSSSAEACMEVSETVAHSRKESIESVTITSSKDGEKKEEGLAETDEIVPVLEMKEEKTTEAKKTTLAECISVKDDEEWSALEGLTRVNSLLSIPRFLSGELRSGSWRKWL